MRPEVRVPIPKEIVDLIKEHYSGRDFDLNRQQIFRMIEWAEAKKEYKERVLGNEKSEDLWDEYAEKLHCSRSNFKERLYKK